MPSIHRKWRSRSRRPTALKQGIQQAQPVLLEPVMTLEVVTPEDFTGDVIGNLNSRRAHVHGMTTENVGHDRSGRGAVV